MEVINMKATEFYEYLLKTYGKEKPIILANIKVEGLNESAIKLQVRRLTQKMLLKKQTRGVYYIPLDNKHNLPSLCSEDLICKYKYIENDGKVYGYYGGLTLLNKAGMSSQVPMKDTVYTNKETNIKRDVKVGNIVLTLRKPYCFITKDNAKILQFLELLRSFTYDEEITENISRILDFIKVTDINLDETKEYLKFFPRRVEKRFNIMRLCSKK